jgi:L-threonylcarbamoyladenylate synthase
VVLHGIAKPADWLGAGPDEAWLLIMKPRRVTPPNIFWLDARGNLQGVARRLFSQLRQLDAVGYRRIHVELAPGGGLADAINDRLRRAAAAG